MLFLIDNRRDLIDPDPDIFEYPFGIAADRLGQNHVAIVQDLDKMVVGEDVCRVFCQRSELSTCRCG